MTQQGPITVAVLGPIAVGKTTVGRAIAQRTGWPLYYNHVVIDQLTPYFPFGSPSFSRLVRSYRNLFFEEIAATGRSVVGTGAWRFDHPEDEQEVEGYIRPFLDAGGRACFVELVAPLEVRLQRNRTPLRQSMKRVDWATDDVIRQAAAAAVHNTSEQHPFPWPELHLRIDNTNLEPDDVARLAIEHFDLPTIEAEEGSATSLRNA